MPAKCGTCNYIMRLPIRYIVVHEPSVSDVFIIDFVVNNIILFQALEHLINLLQLQVCHGHISTVCCVILYVFTCRYHDVL